MNEQQQQQKKLLEDNDEVSDEDVEIRKEHCKVRETTPERSE